MGMGVIWGKEPTLNATAPLPYGEARRAGTDSQRGAEFCQQPLELGSGSILPQGPPPAPCVQCRERQTSQRPLPQPPIFGVPLQEHLRALHKVSHLIFSRT